MHPVARTHPDPADGFDALASELAARFAAGVDERWDDDDFERLALASFDLQFRSNRVFRAFCERRGATPATISSWREVPPVPATAFKHLDLYAGDVRDAEVIFRTSGTTGGSEGRGRHPVRSAALYRSSCLPPFSEFVARAEDRLPFVSLIPAPSEMPESSLSSMMGAAADAFSDGVDWVVDGAGRIDGAALGTALDRWASEGRPYLLAGTAFAFVHALEAGLLRTSAPEGSRIMETGGYKGRSRSLPREDLYADLTRATGIPVARIVNEYGMTELLSQLYEPVLREGPSARGFHVPPPWLRVEALDPTSLRAVGSGQTGILCFFDLANLGSVCRILTEDLGSVVDGRLRLLGRSAGAEPRGCSRAMDDLMAAARD